MSCFVNFYYQKKFQNANVFLFSDEKAVSIGACSSRVPFIVNVTLSHWLRTEAVEVWSARFFLVSRHKMCFIYKRRSLARIKNRQQKDSETFDLGCYAEALQQSLNMRAPLQQHDVLFYRVFCKATFSLQLLLYINLIWATDNLYFIA